MKTTRFSHVIIPSFVIVFKASIIPQEDLDKAGHDKIKI